jgi:hypothetical protein
MLETIKPEYVGVSRISGPIVVVEGVANVGGQTWKGA